MKRNKRKVKDRYKALMSNIEVIQFYTTISYFPFLLQDLFTLHSDTACLTHDLLQCKCDLQGGQIPDASHTQQDDTAQRGDFINHILLVPELI